MTSNSGVTDAMRAEPRLLELLSALEIPGQASSSGVEGAGPGARETIEQRRADAMLAHIAWCRLAEPGDGVAGALISALGAGPALQLLVRGTNPKQLCAVANEAGVPLAGKAAHEALGRWLPRLNRGETVADIERAAAAGMSVLFPGDSVWPTALDDLGDHRPSMLWVRGNVRHLSSIALGVVGARAATGYGSHVTAEIVDGVCAAGVTIVSGAAYGIDAVAHRTALAAETPTIAVVAGGADRPYPQAHSTLLERISGAGAVCSEMIPGAAPTRWRFLMRNRIIAALSQATLVTEAGLNSGSLNTSSHAAEIGRPLGAVPGPVTSAASAGCHRLIRDYAAVLVTNSRDALELLGLNDELAVFSDDESETRDGAWERKVLDAIPLRGGRELSEIVRRAGLTAEQVRGVLAELELLQRVQRHDSPGDAPPKWSLVRRQ